MSLGKDYKVNLVIESSSKYRDYLPEITFEYATVCDNIAYHFSYLEYLYQLRKQIPLPSYKVIDSLRIKTIIAELASIAEVLLFDALGNLQVNGKWGKETWFHIKPEAKLSWMLELATHYKVLPEKLAKRLYKLADLRNKIHLTHGKRDPYLFDNQLLTNSQESIEELFKHFVQHRWRGVFKPNGNVDGMRFPWN